MKYCLSLLLLFSFLLLGSIYTVSSNKVYSQQQQSPQQSNTLCFDDKEIAEQISTIASYDIIIPFTNKNQTTFEPMEVNLPVNTQVRMINLDNTPHHIIIIVATNNNTSNSGNPLVEKVVSLGELITYNFTNPGIYEYFDKNYPDIRGTIVIGDAIQRGEYMSMTIGANLPINTTELKRIVFLIEPNLEKSNIDFPNDLPLPFSYNFTINNPYGTPIYNKQIIDADGKLFFELIPQPTPIYINSFLNSSLLANAGIISNITKAGSFIDFITWGFAEKLKQGKEQGEQTKNCLKGTLHIQGPVLVDIIKSGIKLDKPYSIKVDILATNGNNKLSKPISDTFIIPNK
jgi:plastocyanin